MTDAEKYRALAHSLHSRAAAVESATLRKEMLALANRFETLAAADEQTLDDARQASNENLAPRFGAGAM